MSTPETMNRLNQKLGLLAQQVVEDPEIDVWQFLAVAAVSQLAAGVGLLAVIAQVLAEEPEEEGKEG